MNNENRKIRWLFLAAAWSLAAIFLILHTLAARDYILLVSNMGLSGAVEAATPLVYDPDSKNWIRYALSLVEGTDIRLRNTMIDNFPNGREVNWNSAWAWTIAGAGWLWHWASEEPISTAIVHAAIWLNMFVLMGLVVLFSLWATRRAGIAGGMVVVLGMVGSNQFYNGFFPSRVDHHGLLTASVFGLMLGVFFMGAGWWQRQEEHTTAPLLPGSPYMARQAAIFSAVCGAVGMWISAASVFPPIVVAGLSGLATTLLKGRALNRTGVKLEARCWRIWGRTGAALCVFFYLAEFAPAHLALRLEINHPLYALSWLGGGEFIAEVSERWLGESGTRWNRPYRLLIPLLALLALPVTIMAGGPAVFTLQDPFLVDVVQSVVEFHSPFRDIKLSELSWQHFAFLDMHYMAFAVAIVLLFKGTKLPNVTLCFSVLAAIGLTSMGLWQGRWIMNASGSQICLTLAVLSILVQGRRPAIRWLYVIAVIGVLYLPPAVMRIAGQDKFQYLSKDLLRNVLYRDVAAVLRASQLEGRIVLLSDSSSSTSIGYYGGFQTISSLYWENIEGLKTAAAIFSAHSSNDVSELIRSHGITHIALLSVDPVTLYYAHLHPAADSDELQKSFGYRLMAGEVPSWLEAIPYQAPGKLRTDFPILLYKVASDSLNTYRRTE